MDLSLISIILCINFGLIGLSSSLKSYEAKVDFYDYNLVFVGRFCNVTVFNARNSSEFQNFRLPNSTECDFSFMKDKLIYFNDLPGLLSWRRNDELENQTSIGSWENKREALDSVSVDFINEKLYIIPAKSDLLVVVDMITSDFLILLSNLYLPKVVMVDPLEGAMFILQMSSILTASLDGTSVKMIVEKNGITELALDHHFRKIYWLSANTIESADYEGKNRKVIFKNNKKMNGLAVLEDDIYWYEPSARESNLNQTIWTCNVNNCEKKRFGFVQKDLLGERFTTKAYNYADVKKKANLMTKVNPCKNADCQQICLLDKSFKGFNCTCKLGYRLKNDSLNCEQADNEFILYAAKNFLRGINLNNLSYESERATDAMYPQNLYSIGKATVKDFDYENNLAFLIEDGHQNSRIYVKNLNYEKNQSLMWYYTSDTIVTSLAYDWMSKNIYTMVKRSNELEVWINSFYPGKDGIIIRKRVSFFDFVHPAWQTLIVDPLRGNLYAASTKWLTKLDLSGNSFKHVVTATNANMRAIALDIYENVLYYAEGKNIRKYVNDEWTKTFTQNCVEQVTIIKVYKDWIYVGDSQRICRLNKTNMETSGWVLDVKFPKYPMTMNDFVIFSGQSQPRIENYPCEDRNGGCEEFCFALSDGNGGLKRKCDCRDGMELASDEKSCTQKN